MASIREIELYEEYHIYARGVDKRDTFLSASDYLKFMHMINIFNVESRFKNKNNKKQNKLVEIKKYCLMPNHFHFRLKEIKPGGISKFMQKLLSAYTVYFNKKYNRNGSLFSTTFKCKHVDNELYSRYLNDYIYYNPLKLLREDYKSSEFLLGERNLTKKEIKFLKDYPYKK